MEHKLVRAAGAAERLVALLVAGKVGSEIGRMIILALMALAPLGMCHALLAVVAGVWKTRLKLEEPGCRRARRGAV